jgi:hypothetical protein
MAVVGSVVERSSVAFTPNLKIQFLLIFMGNRDFVFTMFNTFMQLMTDCSRQNLG